MFRFGDFRANKTRQILTRIGSVYNEFFFFCRLYRAASFLKVRMETAPVRILTNSSLFVKNRISMSRL